MLAIIIPYYKRTFFKETLQSLANQTDKRFKVYIGDDASPQDCSLLLEKFEGKFDFVYHRFENNLGGVSLTKQWERCIKLSENEEWLMILGDDDVLGENVVEEFNKRYDIFCDNTNVVRFASVLLDQIKDEKSQVYTHPIMENAHESFYRKFTYLTRSSLSEYVFSRSSYMKYGFKDYPLAWYSDDQAWLDFSQAKHILTINESIVFVRVSIDNISGKSDNVYQKDLATVEFFKSFIRSELKFYDKTQRKRLLEKYENSIKKVRNLYTSEWLMIIFMYVKYYDSYSLKKVVKRFTKTILNYED